MKGRALRRVAPGRRVAAGPGAGPAVRLHNRQPPATKPATGPVSSLPPRPSHSRHRAPEPAPAETAGAGPLSAAGLTRPPLRSGDCGPRRTRFDPAPDQTSADQEGANVTLTRKAKDGKSRIIKIVRTGLTDDTGIFASCTPQDGDPAGSPTLSVFSETGPGGIQVTVDKNLIRSPLAHRHPAGRRRRPHRGECRNRPVSRQPAGRQDRPPQPLRRAGRRRSPRPTRCS